MRNGDWKRRRVQDMYGADITILGSVGIMIAAVHYLLVVIEVSVVRDDIRRLAEQLREREGRGDERL
jgi:hypothetical protein